MEPSGPVQVCDGIEKIVHLTEDTVCLLYKDKSTNVV